MVSVPVCVCVFIPLLRHFYRLIDDCKLSADLQVWRVDCLRVALL